MKKLIALTLVCALCASLLAACGETPAPTTEAPTTEAPTTEAATTEEATTAEPTTEEPTTEEPTTEEEPVGPVGPVVGGWTVADAEEACKLPEEVQTAFDKAMEGFAGSAVTPVAYLGSQVVAGANYALLCTTKPVVPNAQASLKVAVVFAGLDGNAEFLNFYDVDIAALKDAEAPAASEEPMTGAWTVAEEYEAAALPEEVQKAFEAAVAGLDGAAHTPVAYLGSQVVAGANYAVLTASKPVVPNAKASLEVAFVAAPVSGDAAVEFVPFNLVEILTAEEPGSETDPSEEPAGPVGSVVGGWTVAEAEACELPEAAQKAFEKAMEGFAGSAVTPVAYLGSQVVAGTNYALLCTSKPVVPDAQASLKVAVVFAGLDGNAEILNLYDVDIAALKDAEAPAASEGPVAGGWTAGEEYEAAALPEEVQTAFDSAVAGLVGAAHTPVAYLGSQVVAGANYAVLTASKPVVPNAETTLEVAFVAAPVSGDVTVEFVPFVLTDIIG